MARTATIVDCREQCKKLEKECVEIGKGPSECSEQRSKCERQCRFI